MIRRYGFALALIAITSLAAALRLPDLGNRPFHGDEAVHAFKFRDIWEHGVYKYDPNEYHGPTLYYAALPTVLLSGRHSFVDISERDYRLAAALAGIALIPLLLLLRDGLGKRATAFAALFVAISPAFVFYSRYFIQEVLLVFFMLAALACGWRYSRSKRIGWLIGLGACAGLMIATKETSVIAFTAAAIAWLLTRERGAQVGQNPPISRHSAINAGIVAAAALTISFLLLSGFFSNPTGPLGYFRTFTPWLQRAGGSSIHNHPWTYYLSVLLWTHRGSGPVWSEALIIGLALVGAAAVFSSSDNGLNSDRRLSRFIAVFTLVLTIIYSAIPYKTPWCALSFLAGMALLAGIGASVLFQLLPGFPATIIVSSGLAAGCMNLGWQAYRTSFIYQTSGSNPYVYAHPVPDVAELGQLVDDLARVSAEHERTPVKLIATDDYYWPLPWYLRRMTNVGYYTSLPSDPVAPIVIASPEFDEALTKRLDSTHMMTGFKGLRPGVVFQVWVRMDVWTAYINWKNRDRPKPQIGE